MDYSKTGFVYVIQMQGHNYFKIGRAVDLRRRMSQIGLQMPTSYQLVSAFRLSNCYHGETYLHKEFSKKRMNGEWFSLTESDLMLIKLLFMFWQARDLNARILDQLTEAVEDGPPVAIRRLSLALAKAAIRTDRRLDAIVSIRKARRDYVVPDVLDAEIVI